MSAIKELGSFVTEEISRENSVFIMNPIIG